jgi:hypothetical protein
MKIEGVIRVEGVDLHVDVEVADTTSHIYVTNVHPSTLVIPPERLELRWLALSESTLAELAKTHRTTLADLVDRQGNLRSMQLSTEVEAEVVQVLGALRKAALVFDWNEDATKDLTVVDSSLIGSSDLTSPDSPAHPVSSNGSTEDLMQISIDEMCAGGRGRKKVLKSHHVEALRARGVTTLAALQAFGEENLLMTPGFDLPKIAAVRAWVAARIGLPSESTLV